MLSVLYVCRTASDDKTDLLHSANRLHPFCDTRTTMMKSLGTTVAARRMTLGCCRQRPPTLHAVSCRHLTTRTSSSKNSSTFMDPFVTRHLSRLDIAPALHAGVCAALEPVYGKPLTVTHLKSFGPAALQALAESVQQNTPIMDESNARICTVTVDIPHHSTRYELDWSEGTSLLELCKQHPDLLGEYMEGTCGGTMSCCTCHVYVSPHMYEALPEPSEAELDMLDLAFQVQETSRLACQVYINDDVLKLPAEEMVVTIPADVVNLWA